MCWNGPLLSIHCYQSPSRSLGNVPIVDRYDSWWHFWYVEQGNYPQNPIQRKHTDFLSYRGFARHQRSQLSEGLPFWDSSPSELSVGIHSQWHRDRRDPLQSLVGILRHWNFVHFDLSLSLSPCTSPELDRNDLWSLREGICLHWGRNHTYREGLCRPRGAICISWAGIL